MKKKYFIHSNKTYILQRKVDRISTKKQIKIKLLNLHKKMLKFFFKKGNILINKSKLKKKLPFDYYLYEYKYPSPNFLNSITLKTQKTKKTELTVKGTITVLNELISNLDKRKKKREIFYNNVTNFKSQKETDKIIQLICFLIGEKRKNLNIYPGYKGLIFGNLVINIKNHLVNLGSELFKESGYLINFENYFIEFSNVRFVVVIEKETVFFNLLSEGFVERNPGVLIVTGKGYADYCSKFFLKKLNFYDSGILFFYLGDFDVFGIEILLNYMFNNTLNVFENFGLPFLINIGINYEDVEGFEEGKLDLNFRDYLKIEKLLRKPYFWPGDVENLDNYQKLMVIKLNVVEQNLQMMKKKGFKFEIEALKQNGIKVSEFIMNKIKLFC